MRRAPGIGVLLAVCAWLAVTGPAGAAEGPARDCLWSAAVNLQSFNRYYQDQRATYWGMRITPPAGARLLLHGRFPHARYMSLTSYVHTRTAMGMPDVRIDPDPGSVNPFRPGSRRDAKRRSYTVEVSPTPVPAGRAAPNVLATGAAPEVVQEVLLRIYVSDRGYGIQGGVPLPDPELRLQDGTVLRGKALCQAVAAQVGDRPAPLPASPEVYNAWRAEADKGPLWPALETPRWRAYFNIEQTICVLRGLECDPDPPRNSGTYPNPDNEYMIAGIHRGWGPVLELSARAPTTPRTSRGDEVMGGGMLRYWSLCTMEGLATTKTIACRYDEQIPRRRDGSFAVVLSRPEDRPRNATTRCGYRWMAWPPNGDGAGDRDAGVVLLRHMLPARGFEHAVQAVERPGDERRVLGPYYPTGRYHGVGQFEARGCR